MKEKRSSTVWVATLMTALVLLPVLYAGSIGPAEMIFRKNGRHYPVWYDTVYYPLIWICYNSDTGNSIIGWYVELWCGPDE
jgi:hypothetical protein